MRNATKVKIQLRAGKWEEELEFYNINPEDYRRHAIEFMRLRSANEADTIWEDILEVEYQGRNKSHEFSRL